MEQLIAALNALHTELDGLISRIDLASKTRRIDVLDAQSQTADFWASPEAAQRTMQELSRLRAEVARWQTVQSRIADALELAGMGDDTLLDELTGEEKTLREQVERLRLETMLGGEYDAENAILGIHAGAGGTDSQDWAEMLERMYLRWAQENGYKVEVIERSEGEEAGIKSVTFSIRGDYAYGYLQSESGVHRLVRLSPFDAAHRRHTSFSKVELWPDIQGEINIEINEADLKIETYRSSGAGGQNVQKNETAVRITHIPSGVVVQCQNQRSQTQNRERALQILKVRLFDMDRRRREAQIAALKGESVDAAWGNQIRSYVLHPYHLVKDHRTGFEAGNTDAVLNGQLNDFMEAFLKAKVENRHMEAAELELD
jgi:peptide chain release factor 2